MSLTDKFIRYVKIDTQSDDGSTTVPSTMKQFDLAKVLEKECLELGLEDVTLDEHANVMATIPATTDAKTPVIGFLAHMDTADFNGKDVKPRVIENYDGKDIPLNDTYVLSPNEFDSLKKQVGKTLIVTDGTTLLGADDKAGVAEIMEMAERFMNDKSLKHGKIRIAFTPDEEIGRGTETFDVEKFGCDFAYTVDGGNVNGICSETFNAATATVEVNGFSIHPGTAKNKMINAANVAIDFHNLLPESQRPEHTEGYEGFYHMTSFEGNVEYAKMVYILRDHDAALLQKKCETMLNNGKFINSAYDHDVVKVTIRMQYRNMNEILKDKPEIMGLVEASMKELGLVPESVAARGGTDGSALTFKGLPCPNLGTGGYNAHGRYEYAVVEEMYQSVELLMKIAEKGAL